MIFLTKNNPGQLGNRLFLYNLLCQLAKKSGSKYYHPDMRDRNLFFNMEKVGKKPGFFSRKMVITSGQICDLGPSKLIELIKTSEGKKIHIKLVPPILGDTFFDYCFFDPNDFLKIKNEYHTDNLIIGEDVVNIALHFRGTDFFGWDINAVLKSDYYIKALEFCLQNYKDRKIYLHIFTDDLEFATYVDTMKFIDGLSVTGVIKGDLSKPAVYDLYKMSQCDVLISTPSTFSIWGGILGKRKKIIHCQSWLDYIVARRDKFWVQLVSGGNEYYNLWKTF